MTAATLSACVFLMVGQNDLPAGQSSTWSVVGREAPSSADQAEMEVSITRLDINRIEPEPLPVRVVVTDSGGRYVDGSGYGLYDDGRFYADGSFHIVVPPGDTQFDLRSGPNYVPLKFAVVAETGSRVKIAVRMCEWFNPATLGWHAGDNHVHAQHDARADVRTGLEYLALQARASGLHFVTEAGSNVSYEQLNSLDTDSFLLRYAGELRPGAFVGHFNTPGIRQAIPTERYEQLVRRPLPGQAIVDEVHGRGGVTTYTHPLTPPQLRHWMGATEMLSDAVLGHCADLIDLDSEASQQLWFAILNLGNRVAASGSTDSALGRRRTNSPGDRRVYCRTDRLDYHDLVDAMRLGHTMATNGGPLFVFFDIDGHSPGATLRLPADKSPRANIDVRSLYPLRSVELFYRGNVVNEFDVSQRSGRVSLIWELEDMSSSSGWFVARAEDTEGNWAITSPIYVASESPAHADTMMALLEISNHERFIHLRRDYFAHVIVTAGAAQQLQHVDLLRDGSIVRRFSASDGSQLHEQRIPVTQMPGTYGPGWIWHRENDRPVHLQADWPVSETGWYSVRTKTAGASFVSDAIYFDAGNPNSQAISTANLRGENTELWLRGYGEELPLAEIDRATEDDRWWYPRNTYWCLETQIGGTAHRLGSPTANAAAQLFRTNRP